MKKIDVEVGKHLSFYGFRKFLMPVELSVNIGVLPELLGPCMTKQKRFSSI